MQGLQGERGIATKVEADQDLSSLKMPSGAREEFGEECGRAVARLLMTEQQRTPTDKLSVRAGSADEGPRSIPRLGIPR